MVGSAWSEWRFWNYVAKSTKAKCWEWQGARMPNGYGRYKYDGKAQLAHRLAYTFTKGAIPKREPPYAPLMVLHSCDNRACCNPAHLRLGTAIDNAQDMVKRGRCSMLPPWHKDYKKSVAPPAPGVENDRG